MKKLIIVGMLLLSGCASHKQLACRFVAVNPNNGDILKAPTKEMHSRWHEGWMPCVTMIEAIESGFVQETVTGHHAGVEVRGSKAQRRKLKDYFQPAPAEEKGQKVELIHPRFKKLMEVAE